MISHSWLISIGSEIFRIMGDKSGRWGLQCGYVDENNWKMMMMEVKNYEITYFLRNECYQTIVVWEDSRFLWSPSVLLSRRKLLPGWKEEDGKASEILRIEIMLTQASHPCIYPLPNCFKCIINRSSPVELILNSIKSLKAFSLATFSFFSFDIKFKRS